MARPGYLSYIKRSAYAFVTKILKPRRYCICILYGESFLWTSYSRLWKVCWDLLVSKNIPGCYHHLKPITVSEHVCSLRRILIVQERSKPELKLRNTQYWKKSTKENHLHPYQKNMALQNRHSLDGEQKK